MTNPDATFAALHAACDRGLGVRLFTVTVQDTAAGVVRRAYSSHPVDYPVSGTKPLSNDRWSVQVLGRGEIFVANSTAEFADVFFDHALITALGCASAVNVPVQAGGAVLGTVNLLDVAGHFTPERLAVLQRLMVAWHDRTLAAMRAVPMA